MSSFSPVEVSSNFFKCFCSSDLKIEEILELDQEALCRKTDLKSSSDFRRGTDPHELYKRLYRCREENFQELVSTGRIGICEKNLGLLANVCCIKDHRKHPIKIKDYARRVLSKWDPKKTDENAENGGFSENTENRRSSVDAVFSNPIFQHPFVRGFCSFKLNLEEMNRINLSEFGINAEGREETSPHILYEDLINLRNGYANTLENLGLDPNRFLKTCEENLGRLAFSCCLQHKAWS